MKKIILMSVLILAAIAGYFVVSGNNNDNKQDNADREQVSQAQVDARDEEVSENATDTVTAGLDYENGEYTADSSYTVPNGTVHDVRVVAQIETDKIAAIHVYFNDQAEGKASTALQEAFMQAMPSLVEEQEVDAVALSRVGGASLTTTAFNQAFADIKAKAER